MRIGRVLGRGFRALGGALTQRYLVQKFHAGLLLFGSAIFLSASYSPSLAQDPICATGRICQGSGCRLPGDTNNPSDNVSVNLSQADDITIQVTRLGNPAPDTSACALQFDQINSNGQYTSGLAGVPPAANNGLTDELTAGQMRDVVFSATAAGVQTIRIGPPTSSATNNCDNPANRKAFEYTVTSPSCAPPQGPTLRLEKNLQPNTDPGTFNLFIKEVQQGNNHVTLASAPGVGDGGATPNLAVNANGFYRISESAATGSLSDYTTTVLCGNGVAIQNQGSITDPNDGLRIRINQGFTGNAVCTITNTRNAQPTLRLQKETDPLIDTGLFNLFIKTDDNSLTLDNVFDVSNGGMTSAVTVASGGLYRISESAGTNTSLNDYTTTFSCVGATPIAGNVTNPSVGLQVQIGANFTGDAVCTIKNTRNNNPTTGSLIIEKQTIGGNGSFNFSVTGQAGFVLQGGQSQTFNLPTGPYTIQETNLPDGWTLQSISNCGTVNLQNRTVTVDLTTNGATCTFTNFKAGDDPMEEETKRFIHRRVDNLLTYGPDRARMLRRLQEQPREPGSLKDGPLKVTGGTSGGMGLGAAGDAAAPMGSAARRMSAFGSVLGDNPFKKTPLPGDETDEETVGYGQRAGPSVFSEIASQFAPLANGRAAYNFSTSLSAMRQAATEAELRSQQKKVEGLGLESAPYLNPYVTDRNQGLDVWVEGHIAKYDDNIGGINREGNFRLLYVGADYLLAPGVLIGALVQIDDTNEDIKDPARFGKIDGTGWMAGPYVGFKLRDNLFFDARAAWGRSENDILLTDAAAGTRSGRFDTDRWLASATLTGTERFGAWRISPQLSLAYGSESSDAYTNSLGQSIASTDAKIGRLTGTTEIGYRIQRYDGTVIEPHVAISGIWNFDSDDLVINGVVHDTKESRAKVDGGILVTMPNGLGVRASASYDGIGANDYEAVSGSLWLNIPLN